MAFNKTDAKLLLTTGARSKFTDADKEKALRWLLANPQETMATAAEKHGMSTQTLATYRKAVLIEHGLVEAAE